MSLYDEIKNPLDDDKIFDQLINKYSDDVNKVGGFYASLTSSVKKKNFITPGDKEEKEKFYIELFNLWKNNINNLTLDEYKDLASKGSFDRDLPLLRKFLKTVPDVSSYEELSSVYNKLENDEELSSAFKKYDWRSFGKHTGWVHVCSRCVNAKKDARPVVDHRLYLNAEIGDNFKLSRLFIEKCNEKKLPYYFKISEEAQRDDTMVIYSATDKLEEYLDVLKEIKKENMELVQNIKEPPILTGKIDGYIGYGSEPDVGLDGHKRSFHQVRSKVIESVFDKNLKEWVFQNKNTDIKYRDVHIRFQDFLSLKALNYVISKQEKYYQYFEKLKDYSSEVGITFDELNSAEMRKYIYNNISNSMESIIGDLLIGKPGNEKGVDIPISNKKTISFDSSDLEVIVRDQFKNIASKDPAFKDRLKEELKKQAAINGVDSDKFCFDIKARDKLNEFDKEQELMNKPKIDINALTPETLVATINPELLKQNIPLPNGEEISAKDYIQNMVFPQLPQNGIVILNDGEKISAKQFIEENIMHDCVNNYRGNFAQYMVDNTRQNLGTITVSGGGESVDIKDNEIGDFINTYILTKNVNLPNGTIMDAKKYIEEIYAPHIPENGMVTLHNGVNIPVTQFIEEVVLDTAKNRVDGNLGELLYNYTRNNNGVINGNYQRELNKLYQYEQGENIDISNAHTM